MIIGRAVFIDSRVMAKWKTRRLLRSIRKRSKEIESRILNLDDEIASLAQKGSELDSRFEHIAPDILKLEFDVRHSMGFTYKNRPFVRTVGGFVVTIAFSWIVIEFTQYLGLLPLFLSSSFMRLGLSLLSAVAMTILISYWYDRTWCQLCGHRKDNWDSPLCDRCVEDFGLGEVERCALSKIRELWQEEKKKREEAKAEGTDRRCAYCDGELRWHEGWRAYVCERHGTSSMQYLHQHRKRLAGLRESNEEDVKLLEMSLGIKRVLRK